MMYSIEYHVGYSVYLDRTEFLVRFSSLGSAGPTGTAGLDSTANVTATPRTQHLTDLHVGRCSCTQIPVPDTPISVYCSAYTHLRRILLLITVK